MLSQCLKKLKYQKTLLAKKEQLSKLVNQKKIKLALSAIQNQNLLIHNQQLMLLWKMRQKKPRNQKLVRKKMGIYNSKSITSRMNGVNWRFKINYLTQNLERQMLTWLSTIKTCLFPLKMMAAFNFSGSMHMRSSSVLKFICLVKFGSLKLTSLSLVPYEFLECKGHAMHCLKLREKIEPLWQKSKKTKF